LLTGADAHDVHDQPAVQPVVEAFALAELAALAAQTSPFIEPIVNRGQTGEREHPGEILAGVDRAVFFVPGPPLLWEESIRKGGHPTSSAMGRPFSTMARGRPVWS
jgi:hypothetical protein